MTALDVCLFALRNPIKGIVEFFIPRGSRSQLEVIGRADIQPDASRLACDRLEPAP